MLAKRPPLGLFQAQTFGGVYSVVSAMVDLLALTKAWGRGEARLDEVLPPESSRATGSRVAALRPGRGVVRYRGSAQQHRPGAVGRDRHRHDAGDLAGRGRERQ